MLRLHTQFTQKYTFTDLEDSNTESQTQVQKYFWALQGSRGTSFYPNKHRALMIHTVKDHTVISQSKHFFSQEAFKIQSFKCHPSCQKQVVMDSHQQVQCQVYCKSNPAKSSLYRHCRHKGALRQREVTTAFIPTFQMTFSPAVKKTLMFF